MFFIDNFNEPDSPGSEMAYFLCELLGRWQFNVIVIVVVYNKIRLEICVVN